MTAYARSGGAWVAQEPYGRTGGAWTPASSNLWARDAGSWKLIHPDPASVGALLPVENLGAVVVDWDSVTISWTNPTQPDITPTDVQVRLAELGAVWTELSYPATTYAWTALAASTTYVAQVRLVERVNGEIVNVSPIALVEFTTSAAPVSPPAEDPGNPGGTDTIWDPGTTGGTPTPPDTIDGCWWEWRLEILELDTTTVSWITTGIDGTAAGDGDITYDTSTLDATRTYRMCKREACDTTGDGNSDTYGDWECGPSFAGGFDWGVTCGGIAESQSFGLPSAADAVWAFPKWCSIPDVGISAIDAVSDAEIGRGADWQAYYFFDGEMGAVADDDGGITMTAGLAAVEAALAPGNDFSLLTGYRFSPGHVLSNGRITTIASYGSGAVIVQIVETATGWYPRISFSLATSGFTTLQDPSNEFGLDSAVHTIGLRFDDDGDKDLFVDGVIYDTTSIGESLTATAQPMAYTAATRFGSNMQQIGWDRLLSDLELEDFQIGYMQITATSAWTELSGVGSQTVSAPPGRSAGEGLLLLQFGGSDTNDPAGWTAMGSLLTSGVPCFAYRRTADGTAADDATKDFESAAGAIMISITNWDDGAEYFVQSGDNPPGNDTSWTPPSIDTVRKRTLTFHGCALDSATSTDPNVDELVDATFNSGSRYVKLQYQYLWTQGGSATVTWTAPSSAGGAFDLVLLPSNGSEPAIATGTTGSSGSGATSNVAYPASVPAGSRAFMVVQGADNAALTPPTITGWTQIDADLETGEIVNQGCVLFRRDASNVGTEGGTTVSVTWTDTRHVGMIFTVAGDPTVDWTDFSYVEDATLNKEIGSIGAGDGNHLALIVVGSDLASGTLDAEDETPTAVGNIPNGSTSGYFTRMSLWTQRFDDGTDGGLLTLNDDGGTYDANKHMIIGRIAGS